MNLKVEAVLYWAIRIGAYALPFTLLIVSNSMFFPFVSGKNFAFRIIVEVMVAAWAGLLIIDFRKYWPKWSLSATAFVVFVAAVFISAIFGVNFSQSFWSSFERMDGIITQVHLLFLFLALIGAFRTRREWFSLFGVSIVISVLVALYGLLEATGEIVSVADSARIIATLGNPLYVAAYLSFHIFLAAFLLMHVKSTTLKWLLGGVILFETFIFFLTGARGAFVGMLAGMGTVLVLSLFVVSGIKKKLVLGGFILALLLVPVLLHVSRDTEFMKNHSVLSRFSTITVEAGAARFVIWGMAIDAFKERPVLGWGNDNFIVAFAKHYNPKMFGQEPWFDRAHNMPLEWLVAGGAIGFLAYAFFIFSVFWTIVKAAYVGSFSKNQALILIGMMVAYLVQLLFVFDTLGTYLTFVFFVGFFLAALVYSEEWGGRGFVFRASSKKEKTLQPYTVSALRLFATAGVLVATVFVVYFVNIKPARANWALMGALNYFNQGKVGESYESFQKALKLSKGIVGETEATEHMAFNVYGLLSNPESLRTPEGENFYRLANDQLEAEVAKGAKQYPNIKHVILLAQVYHQKAILNGDTQALQKAFENYEKVILSAAPNYVSVYPIYANLLAQTGNLDGAILLTKKASEILTSAEKYDARIFYSLPLFYIATKQYDEAYKALATISEKYSPGGFLNPTMMENIIAAAGSHGKEAVPFLEKVFDLDRHLVVAALMLAQLNAADGNDSQARLYASRALELDPSLESRVNAFLEALKENKKTR